MKNFITAALPVIAILSGCSSLPPAGNLAPLQAAKICNAKIGESFGPDGHLYTTLSIAEKAGYERLRQLTLAYYSQYPDLDLDYEAVAVSIKYILIPWQWTWRNDITGGLHSLHGGGRSEIDMRRLKIRNALAKTITQTDMDWLSGLLIHAYGDAYAHTKGELNSDNEQAYGPWIGHAVSSLLGNNPDNIKNPTTEPKYFAFVNNLYQTIKIDQAKDDRLDDFIRYAKDIKCSNGQCPNFFKIATDKPAGSSIIDKFSGCMNETARHLTSAEVQQAIDLIKN